MSEETQVESALTYAVVWSEFCLCSMKRNRLKRWTFPASGCTPCPATEKGFEVFE